MTMLALSTLACGTFFDNGDNVDIPDVPEVPTFEIPGVSDLLNNDVLFSDDFSSDWWGTGTDTDSSVEYSDEALQFIVYTDNYFVWSTPNDKTYENIHLEVTVINNEASSDTAFGFMCNVQYPIDENHYYFAVTPAGDYAIAKAALAQTDVFLTNYDEWGSSDRIPTAADSYRLGADCGNGKLTLYVDGQEIASVEDTTYTSGSVALYTWSGEETNSTDVSFDDFVITKLP